MKSLKTKDLKKVNYFHEFTVFNKKTVPKHTCNFFYLKNYSFIREDEDEDSSPGQLP